MQNIQDLLPATTLASLKPSTVALWATIYAYIKHCHFADTADKHFMAFLDHKHPGTSVSVVTRHLQRMADAKLIEPSAASSLHPPIHTQYILPKKADRIDR